MFLPSECLLFDSPLNTQGRRWRIIIKAGLGGDPLTEKVAAMPTFGGGCCLHPSPVSETSRKKVKGISERWAEVDREGDLGIVFMCS